MLSLNARVLIAASAILASFFGLAGFTLERAYIESSEQELKKRLEVQVYALIALAAIDDDGQIYVPDVVPETSFATFSLDTYARITDDEGRIVWSTPTPVGVNVPYPVKLPRNAREFSFAEPAEEFSVAMYSIGIAWDEEHKVHTFSVAEVLESYNIQVSRYRQSLWGLLGGVALLLLVVQGAIIRLGLRPLNKAAEEISAIESGEQSRLSRDYPAELTGLTQNVNDLLEHQSEHLERYRHTLDDLAHSLKTPLAVMQSAVDEHLLGNKSTKTMQEQLGRMVEITEYHLQRAATAGQSPLLAPVAFGEMVNKVSKSLLKVYAEKNVQIEIRINKRLVFHGDEGDLMEIIGNLMDNAFKWCQQKVRVSAKIQVNHKKNSNGLLFIVEDDGPGVPEKLVKHVVQRGVRADQGISGQGIGMSLVQDIVQIYGGELSISNSPLKGALVSVWLPERLPIKNN